MIRVDLLGDVLFSMPAVEALRRRYPQARITMLTLPYTASLARLSPAVDDVVEVDTNRVRSLSGLLNVQTWREYWRTLRLLRQRQFDLAISVYGRMGSLCAFLSGAERTVGYAREAYPLLLSEVIPGGRHRERIHEVDYAGRLAQHVGVRWQGHLPTLVLSEDMRTAAVRLLNAHGITPTKTLIVIHAGSVNGSAKRWPSSSWARFADELTEGADAQVVLIGSASDRMVANDVLRRASSRVISVVGETDVETLAGVLARADLVASGDSGPLHLATALGRPVLAVYGPTDPEIYGPYRPAARTIVNRADLPCSPCYTLNATAECPLADPICMRLVSVDRMVEDALTLLSKLPTS